MNSNSEPLIPRGTASSRSLVMMRAQLHTLLLCRSTAIMILPQYTSRIRLSKTHYTYWEQAHLLWGVLDQVSALTKINLLSWNLPLFQEKGYNILIAKLTEQVNGVCWEYSFICIGFFIVVVVWCCFRGYIEQLKSHWVYTKYPRDRSILTWGYRWQRLEPVWWKNKIFLLLQGKTKTNASVLPTATPHVTTLRQALTRQAGSVKRNLQNRVLIQTNTFYKHQLYLN